MYLVKDREWKLLTFMGGSSGVMDFYGVLPSGTILGKVNNEGVAINPEEVRDVKFNERAIDNCTPLSSNAENFIQ